MPIPPLTLVRPHFYSLPSHSFAYGRLGLAYGLDLPEQEEQRRLLKTVPFIVIAARKQLLLKTARITLFL